MKYAIATAVMVAVLGGLGAWKRNTVVMDWELLKLRLAGMRKSFTIWFNAVMLSVLPLLDQVKELAPQVEQYVDEHLFKQVMLWTVIAGNILLRFKTKSDLAEK